MAGGVNAVAKAADGAIYNVSGALAQTPAQNLVLLKADARRALPFLVPSATALPDIGGNVAVVLSPLERANSVVLEEKISGRFSDEAGEWFDATPALPKTSAGAPVIDQRGEVIGIVSFRPGNNSCAIRPAATAGTLLAQVSSNMIASWQTLTTPNDSDGITSGDPKSNAGKDSASRIKIDLRTGATLSAGCKTWNSTGLGQFPRPVRCKWACRRCPNTALDRQSSARPSCRFGSSRLAFGTRAGVESGCTNYV